MRWQPSLGGTLSLGRTNSFFLGGGRAMLNALYLTAEQLGVEIVYDAEVIDLEIEDGMFLSATLRQGDARAACGRDPRGGLRRLRGQHRMAEGILGRGRGQFPDPRHAVNRGSVLKTAARPSGVQEIGDPTQCHAVAIDARAPKFDGGIITRHDCVVFGIVVNKHAQRFYDEGEDIWPKRYAIWGRLVAAQPDQIAYIIFDPASCKASCRRCSRRSARRASRELPASSNSIRPRWKRPSPISTPRCSPARSTTPSWTIAAPKGSRRRRRIGRGKSRRAPYLAYPVRPGITFTYLGTRVNKESRMLMRDGRPSANMFAAGEIMAGNVLGKGYAAGIGMTIGSVFGRIAGGKRRQCETEKRAGTNSMRTQSWRKPTG